MSMNLYYKIIEVYPATHQIVVRYYTDEIREADLALQTRPDGSVARARTDVALDLPIPAPQGDALDAYIMARAPLAWFATQMAVHDPAVDTSLAHILPLLDVQQTAKQAAPEPTVITLGTVAA